MTDLPSGDARLDLKGLLDAFSMSNNQLWIGLTKSRWKWTTGEYMLD